MKLKKILSTALAAVSLFGVFAGASACNTNKGNQGNNPASPEDNNIQETIKPTNTNLLEKGVSTYKIVYDKDAEMDELSAVSELQRLFKEATGIGLEAFTDGQVASVGENDTYIVLGDTAITEEKNLVPDREEYGVGGYVIKTVGRSIFISGAAATGTLYGVYRFLGYVLNYDYFYKDVYCIDKGVADIPLMDYDVSIIPDVEYNYVGYGEISWADQKRYSMTATKKAAVMGATGHASMYYLPKTKYLNAADTENYHPDWYMYDPQQTIPEKPTDNPYESPMQLCYTARGKQSEYELMVETAAGTMIDVMKKDKSAEIFDFSMSDCHDWCKCEECNAVSDKYGAPSAVVVRFLNDMTSKVAAWFETEEGKAYKREFFVIFYAYYGLVTPPAKYDAKTDTFSTIDDSVRCNKYVIPQIADIYADYTSSIYDKVNEDMRLAIKGWGSISENIAGYYYNARYVDYLSPLETFNDMQDLYKFSKEANMRQIYLLGCGRMMGQLPGFSSLRIYLASKLGVDTTINVNEYIDKFFRHCFQGGAESMRKLFDEWRMLDEYNSKTFNSYAGKSSHNHYITKSEYFSQAVLQRWIGYTEQALAAIEPLKTKNPTMYDISYKMIIAERVWVEHIEYTTYHVFMNADDALALRTALTEDLLFLGITHVVDDGTTIDEYLERIWG